MTRSRPSFADDPPPPERFPTRALLGFWAVGSLLQAVVLAAQENLPFHYGLGSSIPHYGLLALLAIPLWRFCAWIGETRPPLGWRVFLHIAAGLVVIVLWQSAHLLIVYLLAGPEPLKQQFAKGGLWVLFQALITYALVVVGIVATRTSRRLRRQQARSAQLQLLAREMEVRALRAQLRPHFLFNVLNSIYSLIASRPEEAQQMVELLAGLMRSTLELSEEDFIPLAEELELVRRYLEIEQIRLGSRLTVDWCLDSLAGEALVPPLLLQPIVENSVKHGVAGTAETCEIALSTAASDGTVRIHVTDDGPGAKLPPDEGSGKGLALTRSRLATLYGDGSNLQVVNLEPRGFEVRIVLPAHPPEPPPRADREGEVG